MSSDRDLDLSVLSRRDALSEAEARRLRERLQASDEERWLHDAGLGFDAETPVVPGDDARIERIVRGVQAARHPGRTAFRGRIARGALGLFLAAGVAAAGVTGERLIWPGDDEAAISAPPPSAPVSAPAAARPRLHPPREPSAAAPSAAPASQQAAEVPVVPAPVRTGHVERERAEPASPRTFEQTPPSGAPVPTARFEAEPSRAGAAPSDATPPAATAEALFAAANRERMRGNASGAIVLYERLRAEFPRSTEAAACNVTLGVLYLQLGRADHALGAFRRSPATAEALWGQAQALQQLGRAREERAVLEDVLRRYPGTAYATAAQKRLTELH